MDCVPHSLLLVSTQGKTNLPWTPQVKFEDRLNGAEKRRAAAQQKGKKNVEQDPSAEISSAIIKESIKMPKL